MQFLDNTGARSQAPQTVRYRAECAALESRPIAVTKTEPVGCYLDLAAEPPRSDAVTYSKHAAPIFDVHCVGCHRPGEAASFSLLTYEDALAWRETIREVVANRRMPPWGVVGGHFANDPSLNDRERATLFAWLKADCPSGDDADRPTPPRFSSDWSIRPDRVLIMPSKFIVPRASVLDYQQFAIDPGFAEDTWIQAVRDSPWLDQGSQDQRRIPEQKAMVAPRKRGS